MQGPQFVFLLLPSLAAIAVAWAVRHWALAAAVFFGCIAGLFVVPLFGGAAIVVAPLLTGGAFAAMLVLFTLRVRPEISVWTKMTIALGGTFLAHLVFFSFAMTSR